jgi:hypothetical protein
MWNLRSRNYELFEKIRSMKFMIREKNKMIRYVNKMLCEKNEIIREKNEKIRAKSEMIREMIRENISSRRKFESWKNLLFF